MFEAGIEIQMCVWLHWLQGGGGTCWGKSKGIQAAGTSHRPTREPESTLKTLKRKGSFTQFRKKGWVVWRVKLKGGRNIPGYMERWYGTNFHHQACEWREGRQIAQDGPERENWGLGDLQSLPNYITSNNYLLLSSCNLPDRSRRQFSCLISSPTIIGGRYN
jgi:hypothetical protein